MVGPIKLMVLMITAPLVPQVRSEVGTEETQLSWKLYHRLLRETHCLVFKDKDKCRTPAKWDSLHIRFDFEYATIRETTFAVAEEAGPHKSSSVHIGYLI